jgi:hypothetical protein
MFDPLQTWLTQGQRQRAAIADTSTVATAGSIPDISSNFSLIEYQNDTSLTWQPDRLPMALMK